MINLKNKPPPMSAWSSVKDKRIFTQIFGTKTAFIKSKSIKTITTPQLKNLPEMSLVYL